MHALMRHVTNARLWVSSLLAPLLLGACDAPSAGNGEGEANEELRRRGSGPRPFTGTPSALPGVVQAEDFDRGGQGVAYFDSDPANVGGEYRPYEGVDIKRSS